MDAAAIDAGAAVGADGAVGAEAVVGTELAVGAAPHKKLTCCFTFMGKKYTVIADAKLAVIRALQKARKSRDVWTVASWAKNRSGLETLPSSGNSARRRSAATSAFPGPKATSAVA